MADITPTQRSLQTILAEWREAERRLPEARSQASRADLEITIARLRQEYHDRAAQPADDDPAEGGLESAPAGAASPFFRPAHQ